MVAATGTSDDVCGHVWVEGSGGVSSAAFDKTGTDASSGGRILVCEGPFFLFDCGGVVPGTLTEPSLDASTVRSNTVSMTGSLVLCTTGYVDLCVAGRESIRLWILSPIVP